MTASRLLYGSHVEANGIRQHYLRYGGAGPALVLVPGITSSAVMWGFVGERLAKAFDVYILDVRGRGLSETGPDLDYGVDSLAGDLCHFAHVLDLQDAVWMGHSMGARVVTRAARTPLTRVQRLLLVDPPVSGPGRRPYPMPLKNYQDLLVQARLGRAYEAIAGKTRWPEHLVRLRAEWAHTCFEPAIVRAHRDFHEDDFHRDLPQIAVPIGLVVAGKGGTILEKDVSEMKALAPALEVRTVADAGHMVPFEDLEGFCKAAGDLLGVEI